MTTMVIGTDKAQNSYLNGHIKRIAYYNTSLDDATLQTLTESCCATGLPPS